MTPQPMYYYKLTGYPPAPAAAVEIEMIHRDIVAALFSQGWRFFSPDVKPWAIEGLLPLNHSWMCAQLGLLDGDGGAE